MLASVAGIVVIGIGNYWNSGGAATAEVRAVVLADLLLVGAVLSWGGYIAVSKPLVERHGAMPALAATCLVGCLLSAPAGGLGLAGLVELWPGLIVRLARIWPFWGSSSRRWAGPFKTCRCAGSTRARSPLSATDLPFSPSSGGSGSSASC